MDGTGITPVMPMGGSDMGFGNGGLWLFAILALMWGGWGGGYGYGDRGYGGLGYRPATAEDVNNGFNFNDLQNQNRDIINAITSGTAQSVATTNQVYHDTVSALNDKYSELQRDVAALAVGQANVLAKQNECCCSTLRAIDGVNYNTTIQVQKVLDAIAANKIEELQSKVNSLELAQAVSGVVRYPSATTFSAGYNPFYGPTPFTCGGNI